MRFFVARVGGLPYVWASRADIPSAWDIGGEITVGVDDHVWLPTLVAPKDSIEDSVEAFAGIPATASITLETLATDEWLPLLTRSRYRGAVNILDEDLPPAALGAIAFDGAPHPSWGAHGVLHIGREALSYFDLGGGVQIGRRGAYGSSPEYHRADWDLRLQQGGGPYVSQYPLTMAGRNLTLWVSDGSEASLDDCRVIFAGHLEGVELTEDLGAVQLRAQSILGAVERTVGNSLIRPQILRRGGWINIDAHNREITVDGEVYALDPTQVGWMSLGALANMIQEAVPRMTEVNLTEFIVDGETRLRFRFARGLLSSLVPDAVQYSTSIGPNGLLEDLGIDAGSYGQSGIIISMPQGTYSGTRFFIEGQRPRSLARVPRNESRVVWLEASRDDLDALAYPTLHDFGHFVQVGETIRPCRLSTDGGYVGVWVGGDEPFNTSAGIDIRDDGDEHEAIFGAGLPMAAWQELVGYLLCGGRLDGSAYGGGVPGTLGGLDPALVDLAAFAPGPSETYAGVWAVDSTSVRELIEPMLVMHQHYLVVEAGRLTLRAVPEYVDGAAVPIGHEHITSVRGVSWKQPEDLIVTTVACTGIGHDWVTGESSSLTIIDGSAHETYRPGTPLSLDLRSVPSRALASDTADRLAETVRSRWGAPFLALRLEIASDLLESLNLGDVVAIEHTALPALISRGVTDLRGWVYRISRNWSTGGGQLTIMAPALDARRGKWAPSARGTGVLFATLTTALRYYSLASDIPDARHFAPGMVCRVYRPGNEGLAVTRTVQSVTDTTIVFTANIGLAAPLEVRFEEWPQANSEQQERVYFGAADSPYYIDGSEEPYHYG